MNSLRTRIMERRIIRLATMQLQTLTTSASMHSSEIQIPIRKERGPTDILQALETTIARDPTAPDYKYIDDPFLIPTSLSKKRMYSLARESGKRAAAWILQEHADLLKSNLSEPLIEAFLPVEKYENKSQVSEEILKNLIKQGRVGDVLHVYHLLEEDVTKETKQAILELLCFYNSDTDQIPEMYPEEHSYRQGAEVKANIWVNNPEIEKLFGELQNDEATTAGAYNALICGMSKYLKSDKAMKLYNECIEKKIPLSVTTYNNLIQLVLLLKDNTDDRKVLIQSFLQNMAKNGIKPNIFTLNAALKSTSSFTILTTAKEFALSLLEEFKAIGITPSLASYYYILLIFYKNGGSSNILLEIMDKLEKNKELTIRDPVDTHFFVHAMEVALSSLNDMEVGDRLHKLLLYKDNYKFIGGRLKESVYYRNYLQLILANDSIDEFMRVYDTLVPHIYIPEPALMKDILLMLESNDKEKATELLSKFASQVLMFDMLDRHQIIKQVFKLMTQHCAAVPGSPLNEEYAKLAWTVWTHIQEVSEKRLNRTLWPANIYGNIAVLLLRGNEFEKMIEILSFLLKSENSVVGFVNPNSLQEIFRASVERGYVEVALMALEYACEFGFRDASSMSKTIKESLPLSETQERQLINLVGSN